MSETAPPPREAGARRRLRSLSRRRRSSNASQPDVVAAAAAGSKRPRARRPSRASQEQGQDLSPPGTRFLNDLAVSDPVTAVIDYVVSVFNVVAVDRDNPLRDEARYLIINAVRQRPLIASQLLVGLARARQLTRANATQVGPVLLQLLHAVMTGLGRQFLTLDEFNGSYFAFASPSASSVTSAVDEEGDVEIKGAEQPRRPTTARAEDDPYTGPWWQAQQREVARPFTEALERRLEQETMARFDVGRLRSFLITNHATLHGSYIMQAITSEHWDTDHLPLRVRQLRMIVPPADAALRLAVAVAESEEEQPLDPRQGLDRKRLNKLPFITVRNALQSSGPVAAGGTAAPAEYQSVTKTASRLRPHMGKASDGFWAVEQKAITPPTFGPDDWTERIDWFDSSSVLALALGGVHTHLASAVDRAEEARKQPGYQSLLIVSLWDVEPEAFMQDCYAFANWTYDGYSVHWPSAEAFDFLMHRTSAGLRHNVPESLTQPLLTNALTLAFKYNGMQELARLLWWQMGAGFVIDWQGSVVPELVAAICQRVQNALRPEQVERGGLNTFYKAYSAVAMFESSWNRAIQFLWSEGSDGDGDEDAYVWSIPQQLPVLKTDEVMGVEFAPPPEVPCFQLDNESGGVSAVQPIEVVRPLLNRQWWYLSVPSLGLANAGDRISPSQVQLCCQLPDELTSDYLLTPSLANIPIVAAGNQAASSLASRVRRVARTLSSVELDVDTLTRRLSQLPVPSAPGDRTALTHWLRYDAQSLKIVLFFEDHRVSPACTSVLTLLSVLKDPYMTFYRLAQPGTVPQLEAGVAGIDGCFLDISFLFTHRPDNNAGRICTPLNTLLAVLQTVSSSTRRRMFYVPQRMGHLSDLVPHKALRRPGVEYTDESLELTVDSGTVESYIATFLEIPWDLAQQLQEAGKELARGLATLPAAKHTSCAGGILQTRPYPALWTHQRHPGGTGGWTTSLEQYLDQRRSGWVELQWRRLPQYTALDSPGEFAQLQARETVFLRLVASQLPYACIAAEQFRLGINESAKSDPANKHGQCLAPYLPARLDAPLALMPNTLVFNDWFKHPRLHEQAMAIFTGRTGAGSSSSTGRNTNTRAFVRAVLGEIDHVQLIRDALAQCHSAFTASQGTPHVHYILIPLQIHFYASVRFDAHRAVSDKVQQDGHTNMIILQRQTPSERWSAFRFEPHGSGFYDCINVYLETLFSHPELKTQVQWMGYLQRSCPLRFAPQQETQDAYCLAWSLFITFILLLNPTRTVVDLQQHWRVESTTSGIPYQQYLSRLVRDFIHYALYLMDEAQSRRTQELERQGALPAASLPAASLPVSLEDVDESKEPITSADLVNRFLQANGSFCHRDASGSYVTGMNELLSELETTQAETLIVLGHSERECYSAETLFDYIVSEIDRRPGAPSLHLPHYHSSVFQEPLTPDMLRDVLNAVQIIRPGARWPEGRLQNAYDPRRLKLVSVPTVDPATHIAFVELQFEYTLAVVDPVTRAPLVRSSSLGFMPISGPFSFPSVQPTSLLVEAIRALVDAGLLIELDRSNWATGEVACCDTVHLHKPMAFWYRRDSTGRFIGIDYQRIQDRAQEILSYGKNIVTPFYTSVTDFRPPPPGDAANRRLVF